MPLQVTILGDGAMATVCATIIAGKSTPQNPLSPRMFVREAGHLADMLASRENHRYLPGVKLAPNLMLTGNPAELFAGMTTSTTPDAPIESLIIAAIPTQFIRSTLTALKPHIPPGVPIVSVAKGIEITTLKRPSEIILEILGTRPVAALSGPNIAGELAQHLPATMVVATDLSSLTPQHSALAQCVQSLFTTPYLRVYRNEDLIGVELAGALKNVIAVAAGILDGMHAGNNAKAALLTRGLVEITRLGVALGAKAETFAGLAGMGDLVTTCVSPEGRNRSFGERIGRGEKPDAVLASMAGVVEGVPTCEAVTRLAKQKNIDMPITHALHTVLFENRDVKTALADLMGREQKRE